LEYIINHIDGLSDKDEPVAKRRRFRWWYLLLRLGR
jgi:hypothetical protein